MSDNSHTSNLAAQLRQNAEDEDLPEEIRERNRERLEELEAEEGDDGE